MDEEGLTGGIGSWPSGVQPRPSPKPPYNNKPILPPTMLTSTKEPPSLCSITRTASGISVNWKEGDKTTDKNKIKELELAKMSRRESTAIGTSHAFDILGEYLHTNSVLLFLEGVGIGPTLQTGHSLIIPQPSEPI
jgi:hypothetical protein